MNSNEASRRDVFENMQHADLLKVINELPAEEKTELMRLMGERGLSFEQNSYFYAQLDEDGRVVGVSQLSDLITADSHGREICDRMKQIEFMDKNLIDMFYVDERYVDAAYFVRYEADNPVDAKTAPEGTELTGYDNVTQDEYERALAILYPPPKTETDKRLDAIEETLKTILDAVSK